MRTVDHRRKVITLSGRVVPGTVSEVPLTDVAGGVAGCLERLGNRHCLQWQRHRGPRREHPFERPPVAGYEIGDPDNARNTFETVLKQSPNHPEALKGRAEVCELLGDYEEAIRSYHQATQQAPKDIDTWKSMGILLTKLKKFGKADKCWNAILRLNPRYAEAWYNKGYAKMLVQKYEDAEKCLKKVLILRLSLKF